MYVALHSAFIIEVYAATKIIHFLNNVRQLNKIEVTSALNW